MIKCQMTTCYVVACTSVLPYSDEGASGEGLLVSCAFGEKEAMKTALLFMSKHIDRVNGETYKQKIQILSSSNVHTI